MNDRRPQLDWIDTALDHLDQAGLRRQRTVATAHSSAVIELAADEAGGQRLVNFGANDYLGLASDPRLIAAVAASLATSGWGSGASPLVCGRTPWHARLEARVAAFERCESSLLFASGFAANVGAITALVGANEYEQDAIYSDAQNHASIIDGCRLSAAKTFVYRHADCGHLESLLAEGEMFRRRLIVTDGLFSMDGDLAPLAQLAELAVRYNAMLMVDEAHATGILGPGGRGAAEAAGVEDRIDVRIGTLSKALGCAGGFVAGPARLVEWLANRARSYVFSTAHPAAMCAAAVAAFDIVEQEPDRRVELLDRAERVRHALQSQGWQTGASASQIIPIIVGPVDRTMQLASELRARGFFVPGIRPPSVPPDGSLLRLSLSYAHRQEEVDALLAALGELRK